MVGSLKLQTQPCTSFIFWLKLQHPLPQPKGKQTTNIMCQLVQSQLWKSQIVDNNDNNNNNNNDNNKSPRQRNTWLMSSG